MQGGGNGASLFSSYGVVEIVLNAEQAMPSVPVCSADSRPTSASGGSGNEDGSVNTGEVAGTGADRIGTSALSPYTNQRFHVRGIEVPIPTFIVKVPPAYEKIERPIGTPRPSRMNGTESP
jgi:hypothetical protein